MIDYNFLITAIVVASIYICCVVLKCNYVTKEKVKIKTVVFDSIIVFVLTFVSFNVIPMLVKKKTTPAFTDTPKF